jgi:hypothetical protein
MDIEAIYRQGHDAGNHLTGLQAVFQAGVDSVIVAQYRQIEVEAQPPSNGRKKPPTMDPISNDLPVF